MSGNPPKVRSRTKLSFRGLTLVTLALGAVIVAVAGALYVRFLRYERVALLHVPEGATAVVRLEVEQALLYEPVRKHLMPLLGSTSEVPGAGDRRLTELEKATGLVRGDLREGVGVRGKDGSWGLILGGLFHECTAAVLAQALGGGFRPAADGKLAVDATTGVSVGQAPDRALVVGPSEAWARDALTLHTPPVSVPLRGPGAAVIDPLLARELAQKSTLPALVPVSHLPPLRQVRVELSFSDRLELGLLVEAVAPADSKAVATEILETLRALARSEAGAATLRGSVDRARAEPGEGAAVWVRLAWEREELDPAFAWLGAGIRNGFR